MRNDPERSMIISVAHVCGVISMVSGSLLFSTNGGKGAETQSVHGIPSWDNDRYSSTCEDDTFKKWDSRLASPLCAGFGRGPMTKRRLSPVLGHDSRRE